LENFSPSKHFLTLKNLLFAETKSSYIFYQNFFNSRKVIFFL
jgi:hypothetical protein